jgi:adenylylsulfate kinase
VASPRALLVNGTVGVGKTSVAGAVGDRLRARGLPGLVIDLDGLRQAWPSPAGDPFQLELTLRNLASVSRHGVEAGARHLVLAGVLENREERARYAEALQMPLTVCRLRADLSVVSERLRLRHATDPDGLAWHLRRSGELQQILDLARSDDFVLDATRVGVDDLAEQVLARWPAAARATERRVGPAQECADGSVG